MASPLPILRIGRLNIRMKTIKLTLLWRAVFSALLLTLIAACDSDDDDAVDPEPVAATSIVRIINAIPDAPSLTLTVNDENFGSAAFGQVSGGFTSATGGTETMSIVYQSTDGETINFLENLTVPTGEGREVYILLTGTFATPISSLIDNPLATTALGVQFGSSVNNGQAVDVYLTNADTSLETAVPAATLNFDGLSSQAEFASGTDYRIRITTVGSTDVLYDSGTISLQTSGNQIFLLVDYFGPGDSPFRVVSIASGVASSLQGEALPAAIRVANFVTNTPSVDFYFNDTNDLPEFPGITFGEYTDYLNLDAGARSINVTPNGEKTNFIFEQNVTLVAGESRTLLLAGDPSSEDGVLGIVVPDNDRPISTELLLRFLHGSAESGAIDFYVLETGETVDDETPDIEGATLLTNINVPVAIGTYDLIATPTGETTVLAGPTRLSVDVGIYTIILTESENGGAPFTFAVREESLD